MNSTDFLQITMMTMTINTSTILREHQTHLYQTRNAAQQPVLTHRMEDQPPAMDSQA